MFKCVQVCWDTNAMSLSLQTTTLLRQPSLELGSFLSTVFTYTVIFGNTLYIVATGFFQQLLNPPFDTLHRNAREN